MTEAIAGDEASKLAYVVDLATKLADRVLDAQISGRAMAPEQISALVSAAELLQSLGIPWPPLMEQVLHEFADKLNSQVTPDASELEPVEDKATTGISRFLGAFRRDKSSRAEA